jgi:hypothetical protein
MSKRPKKEISYSEGFRLADGLYKSFLIYNPKTKKNQRIEIKPPTADLKKAESVRRATELKYDVIKIRAEKRFKFLQEYNDQEKLFNAFVDYRKKAAKRSWSEEVSRVV